MRESAIQIHHLIEMQGVREVVRGVVRTRLMVVNDCNLRS
jgi:hypothetical protein